jgi:hypothetical protein
MITGPNGQKLQIVAYAWAYSQQDLKGCCQVGIEVPFQVGNSLMLARR